jgi:hypothetical protein
VLALAQQTADQAIAEARNEANKIVGEARSRADGLEREARGKADALERDAQEKHRVAMGSLETARGALERKVEDLRAFEREYRQRLKSYLDGQMRQLESQGHDDVAPLRPQLGANGLTPPAPPMPMQQSLPPGMSPVGAPSMGANGLGSTGSYPAPASASALTQTMAPIRPSMPQPPMGGGMGNGMGNGMGGGMGNGQQPSYMNGGLGQSQPSQPSPMRGFLIDEDPDA